MQKIGYLFPGERSSCYVADFIMRQYNRIKSEKGKRFTYRDMKPVFLIVLMEKSSTAFKVVSLDTFHEVSQNIDTKLQAWLTFLSSAEPKDIALAESQSTIAALQKHLRTISYRL